MSFDKMFDVTAGVYFYLLYDAWYKSQVYKLSIQQVQPTNSAMNNTRQTITPVNKRSKLSSA